ncbi:MAG: ABC transporter ATP-binding protein [Steroidobacteraceae bacterium]|jgi:sulfate transport system ATP-binding protein|nr:ABC transporter ATP-binding protein [Steroidobacteraceae bacterium]
MSISLDQVTKRYQDLPVVNDVSLEVEAGEFLVLLGPSGSGKSTLLRAIAGLIDIDHGRIALHGRDVTRTSAREREIGFVFQHYALFRHMTVADNIEFALRVRRVRAAERVARRKELLQLVALEGMDSRLPSELSGGQQQRVAVARALAHRPRVLLMDEPFGALDAKIREELRRTIRQIQRDLGMTTILVTHDQEEAFALADRIGVMHQGRLLECGRPDDLYARPASRFVATFLGAANLLLGYRRGEHVHFAAPAHAAGPPDEVVAVLRPEETELVPVGKTPATPVGRGTVEEVQFGGAVERVRVRLSDRTARSASGADGAGALLDVTRTLADKRAFPVAPGAEVAVGARRVHVLPTPITSFTVLATAAGIAGQLCRTPLLEALSSRMQARIFEAEPASGTVPPGLPVIPTGPGALAAARWQLEHGARQLLCLPPGAELPGRVVIHVQDPAARSSTFLVASSLLRHLHAEAVYLALRDASASESGRTSGMRDLLDARSAAMSRHGLDLRTELRLGDPRSELQAELALQPRSLLVIGVGPSLDALDRLVQPALEGPTELPVLVVRAELLEHAGGG